MLGKSAQINDQACGVKARSHEPRSRWARLVDHTREHAVYKSNLTGNHVSNVWIITMFYSDDLSFHPVNICGPVQKVGYPSSLAFPA